MVESPIGSISTPSHVPFEKDLLIEQMLAFGLHFLKERGLVLTLQSLTVNCCQISIVRIPADVPCIVPGVSVGRVCTDHTVAHVVKAHGS